MNSKSIVNDGMTNIKIINDLGNGNFEIISDLGENKTDVATGDTPVNRTLHHRTHRVAHPGRQDMIHPR